MVYRNGDMALGVVREVLRGAVNDVAVCQDLGSPTQACCTLLVVRDRACAKELLAVLAASERGTPYLFRFAQGEDLCFAFPYRPERRLSAFAHGQTTTAYLRETACVNLVMECLSCPLPYPLLYLALEQGNVHIEKDNAVFFTPYFDLSELDGTKTEADCARLCAQVALDLLESGGGKPLKSLELLRKKLRKHAYTTLSEVYRDIRLTAVPEKKPGILRRIRAAWGRSRDGWFKALLALCTVVVILTLLFLVSQLIFGDIPLFRLFEHSFDIIGTESMR